MSEVVVKGTALWSRFSINVHECCNDKYKGSVIYDYFIFYGNLLS
jgi:hypothetical protein